MKKLVLFPVVFLFISFSAQQQYTWLKIGKYETAVLSDTLSENSGLDFFNGDLLTINDSGNSAEIFRVDKNTGKIRTVYQTGLANIDWEAITTDGENIFVGDFGNNRGTRKDLVVYKIPFKDSLEKQSIKKIRFHFPEQTSFEPKNLNNDFDVEAMVFLNGKVHLFTKEWSSRKVTHYTLDPEVPGEQAVQKIETFPTGYVVTDAAYYNRKLYLVGYTKSTEVYLTIFEEKEPGIFFSGNAKKFYLGSALGVGQIEGIAVDESGLYISGEDFKSPLGSIKSKLYYVPHSAVN